MTQQAAQMATAITLSALAVVIIGIGIRKLWADTACPYDGCPADPLIRCPTCPMRHCSDYDGE